MNANRHLQSCAAFGLLALASCASTGRSESSREPVQFNGTAVLASWTLPKSGLFARPSTFAREGLEWFSPDDLNIWQDPTFRKRFRDTYILDGDIDPAITQKERDVLQDILDLMGEGKLDRARSILTERTLGDGSALFDFILGNTWYEEQEMFQAGQCYEAAVEKHPKYRQAWRNLGIVYTRRGDYADAARAFGEVLSLGQADATVYGLLGNAHASAGNFLSAETAFRMAVLMDGETLEWKSGLGTALYRQGRFPETAAIAGALLDEFPEEPKFWLMQASAFVGMKDTTRAAQNFEMLRRLGAATAKTEYSLGVIYMQEGLADLAVDAYLGGCKLALDGEVGDAVKAAQVLRSLGKREDCLRLIDGIEAEHGDVLKDADRETLLTTRALVARDGDDPEAERAALEKLVANAPLDGQALLDLGDFFQRQGEVDQALYQYELATGIDGFIGRGCGKQGRLLVREGRYEEAIPLLQRAIDNEPSDALQALLDQVVEAAGR